MFPFEGMLKDVAAVNHYNKSDIYNILIKSKELGLEVIPLVQTFGHMEFVLKHGQFAHLRDSADMPESICPWFLLHSALAARVEDASQEGPRVPAWMAPMNKYQ